MRASKLLLEHINLIANWWMIALLVIANQICMAGFMVRQLILSGA